MDRDSRRLPAYGRDLLLARRRGHDPDVVHVLIGDDWSRRRAGAHIALRCEHWRPGWFDWTPCAGLPVIVYERGVELRSTVPYATNVVERVAAELVWCAAIVQIHLSNRERWDIEAWAQWHRMDRRTRTWPDWWSDAHADRAARARQAYLRWFATLRDDRFVTAGRELLATSPL